MEKFNMEKRRDFMELFEAVDKYVTKRVNQYFKDGQKEDFVEFRERVLQDFTCPEYEELRKFVRVLLNRRYAESLRRHIPWESLCFLEDICEEEA